MKVHLFRPQKWVDSLETQGDKELVGTLKGFDEYVSIYSIYSYILLNFSSPFLCCYQHLSLLSLSNSQYYIDVHDMVLEDVTE
jgi:hypothetical protein